MTVSFFTVFLSGDAQDLPSGSKLRIRELHAAVKADPELMALLEDEDAMAELRSEFQDEKEEKQLSSIKASKVGQAKLVARQITLFQHDMSMFLFTHLPLLIINLQANYLLESADTASFGVIVQGNYDETVESGYFGRGPYEAFLRKYFGVGLPELFVLYQDHCSTAHKSEYAVTFLS